MSSRAFSRVSLLGLLVLAGALGLHISTFIRGIYANPDANLLVFAEAPSFARLDQIDPSGWFYQAVLYNPTNSDIVVTGLRWWYQASEAGTALIDGERNAECYDSRYFSGLPTVWASGADDRTRWQYDAGTISITVPSEEIIEPWIEVPTYSRNNDGVATIYHVEAYVDTEWISSPLYVSHSGHDKIASTVFRADFNLTTDPNDEQQAHPNPEWLFNEDRYVVAGYSTRVRFIPVTSSRNTDGVDYATINVTLPSGWSYVPGSAYNPHAETITLHTVDGKDRLEWDLDSDVFRYSTNQSMAQNYMEFNVTAPYVPGIHNFTVTATTTSLVESWTTIENQYIYAVVRTPPNATFTSSPTTPLTGENVTFNAADSYDLDGQILNYSWDFGDGTNATGISVSHTYVEDGNYTVKLTVTDDDGASAIATDVKTVLNRAPVASFVIEPQRPIVGETAIFNASDSYDLDGSILLYAWNFGDGNITTVTSPTVTHTYKTFGNYSVILNVTDNDNFCDSSTLISIVHNVDVAVLDVIVSANEVYVGQTLNISVVVRNEGTVNETFNVTLYYNSTSIGTQIVTDLEPGGEITLRFSWDTADITPDVSYSIRAEASGVAGETDTDDNTFTYDNVGVKSRGTSPPFDWSPILPYITPILLGGLGIAVAGIVLKKREEGLGFEFFNEITNGGIPNACSVMIIGDAASGKSVLSQQLTYEYLKKGKSCVYVTYDIFPSEVRKNMKSFSWNTSGYEKKATFILVDCYSSIAGLDSEEKYHIEQPFALSDLGITMSTAVDEAKHKSTRMFLDSTVPLFARVDASKVTEFLQDRSARIKGDKGVFFFTVGKGTVPSGSMQRLEEIVDCIIDLDVYEEKGKTRKRMRVRKLRGQKVTDTWIPFKIELKKGITFSPPKGIVRKKES